MMDRLSITTRFIKTCIVAEKSPVAAAEAVSTSVSAVADVVQAEAEESQLLWFTC